MKKKQFYTEEEFKQLTGIVTKQRLHQLCKGFKRNRNGNKTFIKPKLVEGIDFIETNKIFFPSALKKLSDKEAAK